MRVWRVECDDDVRDVFNRAYGELRVVGFRYAEANRLAVVAAVFIVLKRELMEVERCLRA